MPKHTLSMLVVTKNRPEFYDWWIWNLLQQTRLPEEVIVVDSSHEQVRHPELERLKAEGIDVVYLEGDPEWLTGSARQYALEHATQDVIQWMDDDDWTFPYKVADLMEPIEERGMLGATLGMRYRIDLWSRTIFDATESLQYRHLPFSAYWRESAQQIEFSTNLVGEDTEWTEKVVALVTPEKVEYVDRPAGGGAAVIHGRNTWHESVRFKFSIEQTGVPLGPRTPQHAGFAMSSVQWEATRAKLEELRQACGLADIPNPPARRDNRVEVENVALIALTHLPRFAEWLEASIQHQSRRPDHIVVLDNSKEGIPRFQRLSGYLRCAPGHPIGYYRQVALDYVRELGLLTETTALAWFDQDDWYYPDFLVNCVEAIEDGANIAYVENTWIMDVDKLEYLRNHVSYGSMSLPFSVIRGNLAAQVRFSAQSLAEDMEWLHRARTLAVSHFDLVKAVEVPTIMMVHGSNVWNSMKIYEGMPRKSFAEDPPPGMDPKEHARVLYVLTQMGQNA